MTENTNTAATDPRWQVVDCNDTPIWKNMHRRENAQDEADRLNAEGIAELAPYRVTIDPDPDR